MSERLHVAVDADPWMVGVVRTAVQAWLVDCLGWPAPAEQELYTAIGEALDNSVEHAYGWPPDGRVTVDLTQETGPDATPHDDATPHTTVSRTVEVVVTDFGRWRQGSPSAHRGNGLALIRATTETSRIETDDAGTRVHMRSHPVA